MIDIDGKLWQPTPCQQQQGGGGKKPKAAKTPDYTMLANKQLAMQKELNAETTATNRVNQTSDYGTLNWSKDANGNWTQTNSLSEPLQQQFGQNNMAHNQAYSGLQDYMSNIQDPSKVAGRVINPGQTAQDAIMARLNPSFASSEDALRTRLINQGVRPGTPAWDNEYKNFTQSKNDAYSQAALQGIGLDQAQRQSDLQEQSLPLQAIQSYINGNTVNQPQFADYYKQGTTQAPDLMGAAQAAQQGQQNANNASAAGKQSEMQGYVALAGTAAALF